MSTQGGVYPASAKLNLFLHVVGRRADGYHLLQTLFRILDHGDRLRIDVRADGEVRLRNPLPGVPVETDLCYRAAVLLRQHTGCRLGADIALEKVLPMGGGLGGGSSDAATVLMALNRLWRLDLSRDTLQDLGLRLGADVPIFIFGRSALAEGVGEVLRAVTLPPATYVVLIPPVEVSTASVFKHPGLTRDTPAIKIAALPESGPEAGFGHNDLEPVVTALYPEVAECLAWLRQFGEARMTGSGACVFAGFADRAMADAVFARKPEHWTGFVADGLDRHPLFEMV